MGVSGDRSFELNNSAIGNLCLTRNVIFRISGAALLKELVRAAGMAQCMFKIRSGC